MNGFNPDWASPPIDTVLDILGERGLSSEAFAAMIGDMRAFDELNAGTPGAIDENLAVKLSQLLGSSPTFWLNRDRKYAEALELRKKRPRTLSGCIQAVLAARRNTPTSASVILAELDNRFWVPDCIEPHTLIRYTLLLGPEAEMFQRIEITVRDSPERWLFKLHPDNPLLGVGGDCAR